MAVRSLGFLACAAVLGAASTVHAYCQTHTLDPQSRGCYDPCSNQGVPTAWPKPEFEYVFNEDGFPGLEDDELRRLIAQSIGTWENVRCDGHQVNIRATAARGTTPMRMGTEDNEPNDNVIVHLSGEDWEQTNWGSRAFAVTAVWYTRSTGVIRGADMVFNGGMGSFGECSEFGCTADDPDVDLRNVATHEFGHLLGLAHSDKEGTTMWCDAKAEEVSKRSLAPDDIEAICDIYPPGRKSQELHEATSSGGGCALTPGRPASDLSWLGLLAPAALGWRRRRRA